MSGNFERPDGFFADGNFDDENYDDYADGYREHYGEGAQDDPDQWPEPEAPLPRRGKTRRRVFPLFIALAALCAMAIAVTYVLSGGSSPLHKVSAVSTPTGFVPTSSDTAQAATEVAQAFLSAWQAGDDQKAAQLTNSPSAALTALNAYKSGLNLHALNLQVQNADESGNVSFSVSATVGLPASTSGASSGTSTGAALEPVIGAWSYTSSLAAGPSSSGSGWTVQWQPTILGANLTSTTHLVTVAVPPGAGEVTDDASNNLAGAADPGLQKIAALLATNAPDGQGTPGINVEVVDGDGNPVPGIGPATVTAPVTTGVLATTIDPKTEAAAMSAVGMYPRSSMVVLQPSTGKILAIANNDQDNDDALTAQIAPGSTMKVVTSTALLNQGMTANTPVACPADYTVTGVTTQNSDGESEPASTPFIDDFAISCNNAFTTQYQKLSGGVLAQTAQKYFGLTEPWDIGLGDPSAYFTMPADSVNSELAAEAFGQGTLEASPLAMASVAATVDTGSFHQPILLPGVKQKTATPLPSGTDSQLRQMMRAVVGNSDGTAHGVGFGSDVYAKTGTADHGSAGSEPNSWIIVFDPDKDVAIGCVVLDGDYGAQSAGPEAKSVLNAL
jgi:Penicillin binding protein transpeptidase domain